ncbi:undecaprenyl-phosphate glucose phosphotransferase [Adhaeribacter sp. BT258]|uniref:Undecaprenyl-phosphate glucose phosphotransferase n=1 Tax=Adhaeribacter terrigena TaxID=2793070 RepID=A0ABS1C3Y3_9BACT|nr:undecaprenyl-phosphate glucose phosphotransferase [Adhaeribacter terrigena]MBK0404110.1 undecaprenyl-phosphate glucose phosphotransferase [Adhaeribacter terrigena]
MTIRYTAFSKALNLFTDFFLLNLSLYTCFVIQNPDKLWENVSENYHVRFLLVNIMWFISATLNNLYEDIFKRDSIPTIKLSIQSLVLFIFLVIVQRIALPYERFPATLLVAFFILFSTLVLGWKTVFLLIRKPRRWSLVKFKKIVIIGAGSLGVDVYNYINKNRQLGYEVAGFFDDHIPAMPNINPILGKINECLDYVEKNNIAEVYCALPDIAYDKVLALVEEADKRLIRIKLVPDVKDYFKNHYMVELYGHLPVLTPRREPLEDKANEIIKRVFDIAFSLAVTVFLLSWLVPLIAIIIKLDSKGPVFFKQLRSGKDNKPFYCLKFRSMAVNFDADKKQATRNDSRITRVGAFLRKSSIDELPQFINVLFGDMSVVGPRPHMLKHTEDYSQVIDKYMVRHFLIPGITGWAQINGLRGETDENEYMEKRVNADIWYLENWSLLLDLKIIVLTAWQTVRGNEKAF